MNSIPYCLIVQSCSHTSAHCKYQFSIEGFSEKLENLLSFFVVWQVRSPWSTWKMLAFSVAFFHMIIYDDSAFTMTRNLSYFLIAYIHRAIGLITCHDSKYGGTNWALGPIFFADEIF